MSKEFEKALALVKQGREINKEAHVLIDLIAAEFSSDPMSTQCFDARIVRGVQALVEERKTWERRVRLADPYMLEMARGEPD